MADIYKSFRGVEQLAQRFTLSKRFDEPTYFSFRLVFGSDADRNYNVANDQAIYDTMPHPLFNPASKLLIPGFTSSTNVPGTPQPLTEAVAYSAMSYLNNSNEPTRVKMLEEFVSKFNTLQYQYPYYFQSIDGISDLLKVDPTKGQRIANDKKISVTCLEGLDLRMSYLMNLYKKIVWDDTYQRWVLPDMMRYFTLKIYLAEFRTFHTPNNADGFGDSLIPIAPKNVPTTQFDSTQLIMPKSYTPTTPAQPAIVSTPTPPLYLKILDNVLPTWEITCEMCEFDITDVTYEHLNSLSVAGDPQQGAVKFSVKIGNIKELQTYPVFEQRFLSDRKLNGLNRTRDEISTLSNANNRYAYPASLQVAQSRDAASDTNQHISGSPYIERANTPTINDTKGLILQPAPSSELYNNMYDDKSGQEVPLPVDNTQPETWVGNAINFGKSFAKGFVNKAVDKAKITNIPGLGVSFTEIKTVLQSKDIISALGLIRKGVNETVKAYGNAPSSLLEQPIQTDNIMRSFLTELTKSEATDDDTRLLQGAASLALSDRGVWEKIRDYSLATNLVGKGKGEVNTVKTLSDSKQYQQTAVIQGKYIALPVQDGIDQPDPNAVSGNVSSDGIQRGQASSRLSGNVEINQLNRGASSERLASTTEGDQLLSIEASEKLGSATQGDKLNTTEPNITTKTINVTQVIEFNPSSSFGIQGKGIKQPTPSQATNTKLQ